MLSCSSLCCLLETLDMFSHQNQHSAGSSSPRFLILSQPESSREEKDLIFPLQSPHLPLVKKKRHKAFRNSPRCSWSTATSSSSPSGQDRTVCSVDGEEEDGNKDRTLSNQTDLSKKQEATFPSDDEGFLLPRSSPVISRRSGTRTSDPSRYNMKVISERMMGFPVSVQSWFNLLNSI